MSFTSDVKKELSTKIEKNAHCRVAVIAALISSCTDIKIDENDNYTLVFMTDTEVTAFMFATLIEKTFKYQAYITEKENPLAAHNVTYQVIIDDTNIVRNVLDKINLVDKYGEMRENLSVDHNGTISRECCKRAYLKGAFMASGSVSDPNKDYHLEINCPSKAKADFIKDLMGCFGVNAKILSRKENYMVYVKEGESIGDLLKVMGATVAVMELENVRILKDMSNYYNRQTNCDAANIKKTVTTARRQIDDIQFIIDHVGIDYLPEKLQQIAVLRLENPEVSLVELGELMEPSLGKSGVNHRLRKISEIANKLRDEGVL